MRTSEPTLRSELRRGVNAYNLGVGGAAGAIAGAAVSACVSSALVADPVGAGGPALGVLVALGVFGLATGLHTAAHGYYGWRFERGIRAAREGRHARAVALLGVVERRGMDHYDEAGVARGLLEASRAALSSARSVRAGGG